MRVTRHFTEQPFAFTARLTFQLALMENLLGPAQLKRSEHDNVEQMVATNAPKPGNLNAVVYALMTDDIRGVVGDFGYAMCLHGSLKRDFDICLVPWTEDADDAQVVVEAVAASLKIFLDVSSWALGRGTARNHGRLVWTLCFGAGMFIDLSVMPRVLVRSPRSWV
jgi:hypothetical protein